MTEEPIALYVLSFDNVDDDPEINWLEDGFVDFIMNHYTFSNEVTVFRTHKLDALLQEYREKPQTVQKKNYVLTGNFKRSSGHFKIDLELLNLRSWQELNSKAVDEPLEDIARVIDDVRKQDYSISEKISVKYLLCKYFVG